METKDFQNLESLLDLIAPQGESVVARSKNFRFIVKCLILGMGPQAVSNELKKQFGEEIPRGKVFQYRERYLDDDTVFQKARKLWSDSGKIEAVAINEIDDYEWLRELMQRSRQNLSSKEKEELKEEIANAVKLIDLKRKLKQDAVEEKQKHSIVGDPEMDTELLNIVASLGNWDPELYKKRVEESLLTGKLHQILKERNLGRSL